MSPSLNPQLRARSVSPRRLLAAGLLLAALAGVAGALFELWRFGPTPAGATARVERDVRAAFAQMTGVLSAVAAGAAGDPQAASGLAGGAEAARALFDLLDRRTRTAAAGSDQIAVTIYDTYGVARAWVGRPSDIRPDRTGGPPAFFVTQSPLGLRLVHVLPVMGPDDRRLGSVAAEHVLSPAPMAATITASTEFVLATPFGPAALRMRWEGAGDRERPNAFVLQAPTGEPLVEASIAPADLQRARAATRRTVTAAVLAISGLTCLLLIGPLLDRRSSARLPGTVLRLTLIAVALTLAAAALGLASLALAAGERPVTEVLLLLGGLTAAAIVALLVPPVSRLRMAWRTSRTSPSLARGRFVLVQVGAGLVVAAILLLFERLLQSVADPATIDLRHFSLHPWTGSRITFLVGILASRLATLWAACLVLIAALAGWRLAGRIARARTGLIWIVPAAAAGLFARSRGFDVSVPGLVLSAAACAGAALLAQPVAIWYRRTTVAARILLLFVAFLLPSLLLYPSVDSFAEGAMRRLIADRYAVEAQNHARTLQERMSEALTEIDALSFLPDLVASDGGAARALASRPAFLVWSQTALARARLTSAVELYDRSGAIVSRFALNFPEYTGTVQPATAASSCGWDKFSEAGPFGSEERRMLHAEKRICTSPRPDGSMEWVGSIVVHVVFDPRRLPFISSQSPYFEVFRPAEGGAPREGNTGSDVDVVLYGWGLGPIYTSGRAAWPIGEDLFARLYDPSRTPFWATVNHGGRYHVHFTNDRTFIYAIGYPALTVFDHLVHLAELSTLAGIGYVFVVLGTAVFTRVARGRPHIGRALLREIRASFYRKLFLAFVLASIVPVLTLAIVIRTYFARQLQADVEAEAARTAAVAQRVLEQSDALQRRSPDALSAFSDDVMVWISQVIDQDVNLFEGPQLIATSERVLFESGLLPTRTPDAVYRAIVLQRLPSFVGEDVIGSFSYLIAATPVRAGGRDAILTVPLANRQREIERETDDLDRGIHLASLCFILLGAGMGLYMAERIADPVRRLTRATRRIAQGDFDAQIAVKSADELRRLVDAFNSMAAELKAQRAQLERTHRIEAWAEMARQVAHEIKNPLTPIQLSAEHLRRVHIDRGEPMGPVLESCVSSILSQVRLLRQISAEFSSFASSPTARPAPVGVPDLVAEVVEPYRTGLAGRIDIDNRVAEPLPRVLVDRTLVTRALANVVENALHAMPGPGALTLEGSADDRFVTIAVRDTGVGMDGEALARVFEPYFSTKATGTGLGLPIARRNIELTGGTISVTSEKGRGTVVRIQLPVDVIA